MEFILEKDNIEVVSDIIKIFFINICTFYLNFKIVNNNICKNLIIIPYIIIFIFSPLCKIAKDTLDFIYGIVSMIILNSFLFSLHTKRKLGYSILVTIISLTINYLIFFISITVNFILFFIFKIQNDYINIFIMIIVYLMLFILFLKIKRFKKGFSFLVNKIKNEYLDILILNICAIILLTITLISNYNMMTSRKLIINLVIFFLIMFITIQKSLQLYYKQKMLVKDLEETKAELEEKNIRIKELENEIIKSGKKSHSISHRQDILEHKLEELNMKSEISEMDIKSRIEKVGKDIRKEPVIVLAKTGIAEIDDVLDYMKSECVKKKIDFQLQLSGNIYKMINNYVSKDELEILLADHIKNAIIAIEYSNNINKSILVRLGRLDGTYGLYVYDSGIEFEKETLLKLGKKPATTHKDSGGTGMGFMNTFDTLRKHNASFIIEEYGKPVTDNFTKVLKFKFDGKKEFKICTYRKEEIEKQDKEKTLVVEKLIF